MRYMAALILLALSPLAGCTPGPQAGVPRHQPYNVTQISPSVIAGRMLAAVNQQRSAAGLRPLSLNPQLGRAAQAHAKDMSKQRRPWPFSSNGDSPLDRAASAGFSGVFVGELISESYETGLETVAVWLADPRTHTILMDPKALVIGVGIFQDRTGKIWWVLDMGVNGASPS